MLCRFCGNEMNDGAAFCPHCGAANGAQAPSYPSPEAPAGGGGKKKTGLIIGGAVVLVAAMALIVAAVTGLFANPKAQVEKAMAKSAAAYAAAEEKLGMPDAEQWRQDKRLAQQFDLKLTGINSDLIGYDLSALEGLGIHMDTAYNLDARALSFELGAYWNEDDLLSFSMDAEDDKMYFRSPQFTGETSYGVNTETLGSDLTRMTGDDSMDSISFNLFDLMDKVLEQMDPEAMEEDLREANRALWEAAQVKKQGSKTLDLNGTSAKTTLYHVTIPQEALEQYVDDMAGVMSVINYYELYQELFQSMGVPQEEVQDFLDELEDLDVYGELADTLKDALEDFGDLELDVCLSGGYVSALLYEGEIDGADVALALYLGGSEAYVDNLSAELTVEDIQMTLESSGDHGLKGGTYTDNTTIRVKQAGANVARITSTAHYDPKAEKDNFQWKLGADSSGLSLFTLETAGSLTAEASSVNLELEDISLRVMGMEVCNLSLGYSVSADPRPLKVGENKLITEMDMTELTALADQIQTNAETWAEDMQALFLARLPQELLWAIMYA